MKHIYLMACLLAAFFCAHAQVQQDVLQKKVLEAADPSTHVKSIRTNIFVDKYQALLKSGILSQNDAGLKVSTTVYGLFKLFDSTIAIDTNYSRYKWGRNLAIGAGITMGDDNRITAVTPSFTWAVVNGRELSVKKHAKQWAVIKRYVDGYEGLLVAMETAVNANTLTQEQLNRIDSFNVRQNLRLLQGIVPDAVLDGAIENQRALDSAYRKLEHDIKAGPLFTVGFDGNYADKSWSTLDAKAEFLVGTGFKKDREKNWDFYSGAFFNAAKDTVALKNLRRQSFSVKAGLNKVLLKTRDRKNSIVEVLGSLEYRNILQGAYAGETASNLLANFTFSIRLANDLYLPVEIKYDPRNGKFLGFIDLKFDIRKVFLRADP
ncbi:hypothetical protein EGT74_25370 [Chitinophaga lutea]|uniref:DUF3078 domain-containing protein n=1 Tax=Chitinophaga lutea TaxID=2488634 RepID=A0A3N4PLG0_9BACT|nr:hypothetical protein [Chitinophaga lutea]RPE05701.1 hypothetical protein EGT74_25370 [Chitinophaga lutea]